MNYPPTHIKLVCHGCQLSDNSGTKTVMINRVADMAVKITIRAFFLAKRPVNINAKIS
jgi:hypothetical protein